MPDNSTQTKAEEALKTLIDALTLQDVTTLGGASSSHVFTGVDGDTLTLPAVVCLADGQWQEPETMQNTGNLRGQLLARVRTNANDTDGASVAARESHIARVTAIRNGIFVSDLAAQLSAAVTQFYCIGVISFSETNTIQDAESWQTDLVIDGIFAANDL
jgi:hypothetical protein